MKDHYTPALLKDDESQVIPMKMFSGYYLQMFRCSMVTSEDVQMFSDYMLRCLVVTCSDVQMFRCSVVTCSDVQMFSGYIRRCSGVTSEDVHMFGARIGG